MHDRDRENLLSDLRSPDDELRRLAVERLTLLPAEEATRALVEQLGDPSWRVRKAAIERLAAWPDAPRVVHLLLEALADGENPGRRNAALEALTHCGSAALPTLLEATRAEDVDVRKQVVDALAAIADPRSGDRLSELLADPDANVRGAAADALGAAGSERTAPALLAAAAQDPERLVRLSALRALVRLDVPIAAGELEPALSDPVLRPAAYALLGGSDDPQAVEWLMKGVEDGSRTSREAAMEALVRSAARLDVAEAERLAARVRERLRDDEELVRSAVDRLGEASLGHRLVVVQFLGLLARPDTVGPLLEAGLDEALTEIVLSCLLTFGPDLEAWVEAAFESLRPEARCLAAELLGRTEGELGERRLRRALAAADPEIKAAAARALGRRGAQAMLPELVSELESAALAEGDAEDEELVAALAEALVALAGREPAAASRALALLGERMEAAPEPFRVVAARTMGEIGGAGDAPRIGFLLSDPSERVRRAAAEALGRIAHGTAPEPLRLALADEAPAVRIGAASALAASGDPRVLEDFTRLALDDDERVRAAAMRAAGAWAAGAGQTCAEQALELLGGAFAEGGSVAMAALEALCTMGGEQATRMASRMLDSAEPELVQGAIECVGRHAEEAALAELVPVVSHADWSVRSRAVEVLAERGYERVVPALLRRLEEERDEFVREAILRALERLER
jgi:HEAT repeat protein